MAIKKSNAGDHSFISWLVFSIVVAVEGECMMHTGSMVALVTPMTAAGEVDYPALAALIAWHIAQKTDALVVLGTTGEAPTLSREEQQQIVTLAVTEVAGRIPVLAGAGTNSTASTVERVQAVKAWGADGALVVTPYYSKPTQEGLYQHYTTVCRETSLPMMLYNVPGRTGCDLYPETVARLSQHDAIVAIKEASGDVSRIQALVDLQALDVLSGDDISCCDALLAGAKGVVSVTANVVPQKMHEMVVHANAGHATKARALQAWMAELHALLFVESNPIPIKWALARMGKIASGIRLPLTVLSSQHQAQLGDQLQLLGLV
jgi:4-hydroxy-tetrahydrodipicolinate synthase